MCLSVNPTQPGAVRGGLAPGPVYHRISLGVTAGLLITELSFLQRGLEGTEPCWLLGELQGGRRSSLRRQPRREVSRPPGSISSSQTTSHCPVNMQTKLGTQRPKTPFPTVMPVKGGKCLHPGPPP